MEVGTSAVPRAVKGKDGLPPLNLEDLQLSPLRYFGPLRALLTELHDYKKHPNRKLFYDGYVSLLLLCYFNPVIRGLRQIQQFSSFAKIQKELGVSRASPASLSEASRVFDPKPLAHIFERLAAQVCAKDTPALPEEIPADMQLIAVDGTLMDALGRMFWAVWLDQYENAAKVHLHFNVSRGVPVLMELTDGNGDEKKSLREHLAAGCLYLLDRGYVDYKLYQEISAAGSSCVGRLRCNAAMEVITSRPLTAKDRAAGIETDQEVWLGGLKDGTRIPRPVRVLKVHVKNPPARNLKPKVAKVNGKVKLIRTHEDEFDAWLVTDRMDLPADVVVLLYRYRWHVEIFFRWFKCVLGCRHLFAESPQGLTIQIYSALIAGLLIVLWTGCKPTRYVLSALAFYFAGLATWEELRRELDRLKPARA
jgi:Transposase DDE domain